MLITTIFLDFGNVCVPFTFARFFERMTAMTGVTEAAMKKVLVDPENHGYSPLFEDLECGRVSPTQFFHILTKDLGIADKINYSTFAKIWTDIWCGENAELDKLLARISQKKILLSNTNHLVHRRYIAHAQIIRNHFPPHQRILSCVVGAMKPHAPIYEAAFRLAGTHPSQCLFIDDMPTNIAAWEALGGHGIVYNAHHDTIEMLEEKLTAYGIKIS